MIILSWNVRGLNSIPRQKAIHELVVEHSPDILCIQETKLSVDSMFRCVSNIWLLSHCQCVGALGSSGGLAICWDPRKVTPLY